MRTSAPNLLDVVFTHYEQPRPQPFQRSRQLTGTRTFDVRLSESIEALWHEWWCAWRLTGCVQAIPVENVPISKGNRDRELNHILYIDGKLTSVEDESVTESDPEWDLKWQHCKTNRFEYTKLTVQQWKLFKQNGRTLGIDIRVKLAPRKMTPSWIKVQKTHLAQTIRNVKCRTRKIQMPGPFMSRKAEKVFGYWWQPYKAYYS